MTSLEERVKRLEAQANYQDRRYRRLAEALRTAAGHLWQISDMTTLSELITRVKKAASHLRDTGKDGNT